MHKKRRLAPKIRIENRDGRFHIVGMGAWHSYWRDPYHLVLTLPWFAFLALLTFLFFAANALFALLYLADKNSIANARPGSFLDTFFFSVQTMATIGYGTLYPRTVYGNVIVTIEAMVGLLGVAILTGLAFARFSRPSARVVFSRVAVIAPHDGVPTLMFRTANQRRNQVLEAQLRARLVRDEITLEGQFMRRIYDLKLLRSQTPVFALSWTLMHSIDENSPLHGATPETLADATAQILVTLTGIDETVSQTIHARHTFAAHEIMWNMRFVDTLTRKPDGQRYIDYALFHDVTPV
jgi:inward rectifier potassium channel